jgi:hypothetical protein
MPPDVLDTGLGALRLSILFFVALLLPLILQLLLLYSVGWAFDRLVSLVSSSIASLFGLIGTPVHEFSHAIANLITLCGVAAITPLIDNTGTASVYPRRSHFLQRILAGLAPLIGGTLVLWLTATYVIPGLEVPIIPPPQLDLESAGSLGTVLRESMAYLGDFLEAVYSSLPGLAWDNWRTYVGLYIALSVGAGIAPSSQDLRNVARGLPLTLLFVLGLFAWLYVSGDAESRFLALQEGLVPRLIQFSTAATYAFLLTMFGTILFLALAILKRWRPI